MPPVLFSWLLDLSPSLLVVAISTFVLPPQALFDLHPILAIVSAMLIMPWAIRALDRDMSWMAQKPRASKIQWHWILQLCAVLLMCLGSTVIFTNKYLYGKPHYTTWHGLLGLITTVYAILVTLAGFVMYWKLWPIGRLLNYGTARTAHMYFGLGLITLAGVTTALGMRSNWCKRQLGAWVGDQAVPGLIILCSVIALFPALRIGLQVRRIRFRQVTAKSN